MSLTEQELTPGRVALAYSGVHQIFQLALAAHEIGELDGLFCSIIDGEGRWGRRLGKTAPAVAVRPLGWEGIPQECVMEYPWPLLVNRLFKKLLPRRRSYHVRSNRWFDSAAARWLRTRKQAKVFIGVETCALKSLVAAGQLGMKRILDCPGVPAQFLEDEAAAAARDFGISWTTNADFQIMQARKSAELDHADLVICCSEFQRQRLVERHPRIRRCEVIPLWTDAAFWSEGARPSTRPADSPLRVLYAGAISLKKGVPYLLRAVEGLERDVSLTLVGKQTPEMSQILPRFRQHRHLPYLTKTELRALYREHDVLVMPTLGDSFGFVILEAMSAGIPVIASTSAGAPLPDESWRFPARDADALAARLRAYAGDESMRRAHAEQASTFARAYEPSRYRRRAAELMRELIES